MSPLVAKHLHELRQTMDASFHVLEDDGTSILVRVVPSDLPEFLLRIDPRFLDDEIVH
jgi:hypothetical protein